MDDVGRGLVFPYSVVSPSVHLIPRPTHILVSIQGGVIMLGLVIGSLSTFAGEISQEKVVNKRFETQRRRTIERSTPKELGFQEPLPPHGAARNFVSGPFDGRRLTHPVPNKDDQDQGTRRPVLHAVKHTGSRFLQATTRRRGHRSKDIILREERDRFNAMREVQRSTKTFKAWSALTASVIAFATLWCAGAAVFYATERHSQGLSYFQALYFCYVSLLTIGYGDLAPKSNAGRPFFVVWSLLAVPTMTILVSDLGETVISKFQRGTNIFADFTVLPKQGIWRTFLNRHPWLLLKIQKHESQKKAQKSIAEGSQVDTEDVETEKSKVEAKNDEDSDKDRAGSHVARRLAAAIRRTARDMKQVNHKKYSFEEWLEFTELIKCTSRADDEDSLEEDERSLIEWDWIGEDSPMMARSSEPEFVLERLCESVSRFARMLTAEGGLDLAQEKVVARQF